MNNKIKYVFASCLTAVCFNAYASIEDTHVTITNNTDKPIYIHTNLATTDQDFKEGSGWNQFQGEILPYESKQVLTFTRHFGLKYNTAYTFDLIAGQSSNVQADDFIFRFDVIGSYYYGSTMTNALEFPMGQMQPVLMERGLEHYSGFAWGGNYAAHIRRWQPRTNLFSDVQVVIDKVQDYAVPMDKDSIHILTYNTQLQPFYGRAVNDLNQPAQRVEDIVPAITHYDAVIFEELFDHELRGKLTEKMTAAYPYHTRVVGDQTGKTWTGGVMIFSKWPIESEAQIVYQATTGADSYAAKGAVYARIDKEGKLYHLFGTHLEADHTTDDVRVRRKQLTELANFIDRQHISPDEPVLIGGDMNIDEFALESSTLYEYLNAPALDNLGYQYSCDPLVNTMNVGTERERLDYVLYDKRHLQPKQAYNRVFVLRALQDETMWPKFDLSDHFPVEAYFKF